MKNYNKSRIYKIWSDDDGVDEFYIGSSKNFSKRKRDHESNCSNSNCKEYRNKLYTYIRNNGGFGNFYIDVIKKVACKNKTELRIIEQHYIDELKPTLNNYNAYISREDELKIKNDNERKRYQLNKTIINQKKKEIINCDRCDKTYTKAHKSCHQKSKYCINYNSNKNV